MFCGGKQYFSTAWVRCSCDHPRKSTRLPEESIMCADRGIIEGNAVRNDSAKLSDSGISGGAWFFLTTFLVQLRMIWSVDLGVCEKNSCKFMSKLAAEAYRESDASITEGRRWFSTSKTCKSGIYKPFCYNIPKIAQKNKTNKCNICAFIISQWCGIATLFRENQVLQQEWNQLPLCSHWNRS